MALGQGGDVFTLPYEDFACAHHEGARRDVTPPGEVGEYLLDALVPPRDRASAGDRPDDVLREKRPQSIRGPAGVEVPLRGMQPADALASSRGVWRAIARGKKGSSLDEGF
jgi:hypothetical protein